MRDSRESVIVSLTNSRKCVGCDRMRGVIRSHNEAARGLLDAMGLELIGATTGNSGLKTITFQEARVAGAETAYTAYVDASISIDELEARCTDEPMLEYRDGVSVFVCGVPEA